MEPTTTAPPAASFFLDSILSAPSDTDNWDGNDQGDMEAADAEFLLDEFGGAEDDPSRSGADQDQDKFLREAFERGLDLREYAKHIEVELAEIEESHIVDYMQRGQSLVALYRQIQSCDQILGGMESMLSGFQEDLGKLSTEIQTLQDQSFTMSVKLKNRLAVKQLLGTVLEGIVLSPEIIKVVCDVEISDMFVQILAELNRKLTFAKNHQGRPIRAFRDVSSEMEKLRMKATEKGRAFFIEKMKSFTAPNANVAIIQQSVLLRYKSLHHFIIQRHTEAAAELRFYYLQLMGGYIYQKFGKYLGKLQKLQSPIADKYDMLGLDDGAKKGLFGSASKVSVKDKANVFTIGDRIDVLSNIDAPVILPHSAEEKQLKFPFEAIFRSICRVVLDNASSEYCFISEFFCLPRFYQQQGARRGEAHSAEVVANEVFTDVFGKTIRSVQDAIRQYTDNSFDAVGLLLCIRINTQHQLIMQKRRIPCLDQFLMGNNLLMWPRFQSVMDMHIASVKRAATGSGIFATVDVAPHFITRRYAEFAVSILALNHGYDDPLLETSLSRLRAAVEDLISRMANESGDKKKKLLIYINNFDLIVSILDKCEYPTVQAEKEYFGKLLDAHIVDFVEEELTPHFGGLIAFVRDVEKAQGNIDAIAVDRFEKVAKDFAATWRGALNDINTNTMQLFSNFKNGTLIVQTLLKQLVVHYQTFLMLWERRFPPNVKLSVQPVMMHQLVVEIKSKYKSNF